MGSREETRISQTAAKMDLLMTGIQERRWMFNLYLAS